MLATVRAAAISFACLACIDASAADKLAMPPGCKELFTSAEYNQAGGVSEPQQVVRLPAQYPPDQLRAGNEGVVELEAVIGVEGKIVDVRVVSATNESFARSAIEATLKFVYDRPRVDGRPVCVTTPVRHDFKLT